MEVVWGAETEKRGGPWLGEFSPTVLVVAAGGEVMAEVSLSVVVRVVQGVG